VSELLAVRSGELVEKRLHIKLARLGFHRVKAARNDRQERGRVERIEGLKNVVRRSDERGQIERNSQTQQADENEAFHAQSLPWDALRCLRG
jgi:hypothetical protein